MNIVINCRRYNSDTALKLIEQTGLTLHRSKTGRYFLHFAEPYFIENIIPVSFEWVDQWTDGEIYSVLEKYKRRKDTIKRFTEIEDIHDFVSDR